MDRGSNVWDIIMVVSDFNPEPVQLVGVFQCEQIILFLHKNQTAHAVSDQYTNTFTCGCLNKGKGKRLGNDKPFIEYINSRERNKQEKKKKKTTTTSYPFYNAVYNMSLPLQKCTAPLLSNLFLLCEEAQDSLFEEA